MKVKLGKYKSWFGPYQLAEFLCFWAKKDKDEYGLEQNPEWVHTFGEWLAHGHIEKKGNIFRLSNDDRHVTWIYKLLSWIDSKRKRTEVVRIDRYDTWNMAETLALIILPMLKQLHETKHGSPFVEDEDVPEGLGLRSTDAPPVDEYDSDDNIHKRWDWVMEEMIWAFEQINDDDNDRQFFSGESDIYFERVEGKNYSEMKRGPKDTMVYDKEGHRKHEERIQNGLRLFAKYYRGLWD